MIEIILFAIIAFFLFKKLKDILGQEHDDEMFGYDELKDRFEKNKQNVKKMKIIIQDKSKENEDDIETSNNKDEENKILDNLNDGSKKCAEELSNSIDNFSLVAFKKIASTVMLKISQAREEKDEKTIKSFFQPELAENLIALLNDENFDHVIIVSIDETKIAEVSKSATTYKIVVEFKSQQINYTTDKDGTIIDGSKSEILNVVEKWHFTRDINSSNSTWFITEIEG